MKNKFPLMVLCFLAIGAVSLPISVLADDDEDIDEETEAKVRTMDSSLGKELRLLQLERQILIKILRAQYIVNYLENKSNSTDTSELESIIAELKLLKEEVNIDLFEGIAEKDEAIQKFIDIKHDARDLIAEFREKAKEMLSSEDKEKIREGFKDIDSEELKDINERIKEIRNLLQEFHVQRILDKLKIKDEKLKERIRMENITLSEAKQKLKEHYNNLSEEVREKIEKELRNDRIQREIAKNKIIKGFKENMENRISDRLKNRTMKLEAAGDVRASNELKKKINRSKNTEINPETDQNGE